MEILHDDQDGCRHGESLKEAEQRFEQSGLEPLVRRQRPREADPRERMPERAAPGRGPADPTATTQLAGIGIPDQPTQRLNDRPIGNATLTDVGAGTPHHPHAAFTGRPCRLVDEPALADTGLAGNQPMDRPAENGRVEPTLDRKNFSLAPDDGSG